MSSSRHLRCLPDRIMRAWLAGVHLLDPPERKSSVSQYREGFYQRFFCRRPKKLPASSLQCRRVIRERLEPLKVSSTPSGWRTSSGVMETQGFLMVSAAPAVGASSAAACVSAGAGQEALAPVVHTAGALRGSRSRRTFATKVHEFPRIGYDRRS